MPGTLIFNCCRVGKIGIVDDDVGIHRTYKDKLFTHRDIDDQSTKGCRTTFFSNPYILIKAYVERINVENARKFTKL